MTQSLRRAHPPIHSKSRCVVGGNHWHRCVRRPPADPAHPPPNLLVRLRGCGQDSGRPYRGRRPRFQGDGVSCFLDVHSLPVRVVAADTSRKSPGALAPGSGLTASEPSRPRSRSGVLCVRRAIIGGRSASRRFSRPGRFRSRIGPHCALAGLRRAFEGGEKGQSNQSLAFQR